MAAAVGIERGVMVQPEVHRWDSASTLDAIAIHSRKPTGRPASTKEER